jgi:hypothetical protein
LGHDQLDILILNTGGILLSILILIVLLAVASVNGLALAMIVVMVVVMAGVVMSCVVMSLLRSQLLSGRDLGLGVEVLDLGFTENTACNALVGVLCKHLGLPYM